MHVSVSMCVCLKGAGGCQLTVGMELKEKCGIEVEGRGRGFGGRGRRRDWCMSVIAWSL